MAVGAPVLPPLAAIMTVCGPGTSSDKRDAVRRSRLTVEIVL
jgi:hypothetical protein